MHYDEGTLLGHLDGELDATKDAEVTKHLAECDECRETVARLEADRSVAADAMAALQPTGEVLSMPERRAR